MKVTVPTEPPNDEPPGKFVPKTVLIEFTHPEHGAVWISAQENDMNDQIMVWDSLSTAMHAYEPASGLIHIKAVVKNIRKQHPDAVINSNYKPWS
jgi:hypothetical protein